jgi:hypothetical protein
MKESDRLYRSWNEYYFVSNAHKAVNYALTTLLIYRMAMLTSDTDHHPLPSFHLKWPCVGI